MEVNALVQQIESAIPEIFEAMGAAALSPAHPSGGVIPEGRRNVTLFSMTSSLRRMGLPPELVESTLQAANLSLCSPPMKPDEVTAIARSGERYRAEAAPLVGFSLSALHAHTFPTRRAIFTRAGMPIFREGHLGQVSAPRGIGKTWCLYSLALAAACGGEVMGIAAPEPCRVLYVDGEMAAEEIQERFAQLGLWLGVPLIDNLQIVAAAFQDDSLPRLDTAEGQALIEPWAEAADLIILDNRSCLFDPESETDPAAWEPAQRWLLAQRHRGKAVLLAHHANRQGGARGHSKPEDPLNLMLSLSRPEDYQDDEGARFTVTFTKGRGAHGASLVPFTVRLSEAGWLVEGRATHAPDPLRGRVLEAIVRSRNAGQPLRSKNQCADTVGANRSAALRAVGALLDEGLIVVDKEDGGYRIT